VTLQRIEPEVLHFQLISEEPQEVVRANLENLQVGRKAGQTDESTTRAEDVEDRNGVSGAPGSPNPKVFVLIGVKTGKGREEIRERHLLDPLPDFPYLSLIRGFSHLLLYMSLHEAPRYREDLSVEAD